MSILERDLHLMRSVTADLTAAQRADAQQGAAAMRNDLARAAIDLHDERQFTAWFVGMMSTFVTLRAHVPSPPAYRMLAMVSVLLDEEGLLTSERVPGASP